MPARLKTAFSVTVGLAAMLFVATVVVAAVLLAGLDPWQRTEALAVLRGTHRAVKPGAIEVGPEERRREDAELRDRLQALAKEIEDHRTGLAMARGELISGVRAAVMEPAPPRVASADARLDEARESIKDRPADEVAGFLMKELREGRTDDTVEIVREMPGKRKLEVLSFIADPIGKYRRLAGARRESEGAAAIRARLELEKRAEEMSRHYRIQRGKLMLLMKEIKERESGMEKARQALDKRVEAERAERDIRETQAAQASRQKVLKLFGTMEAEQVSEYIGRMVREEKLAEAAEIVRALSDRRAAEILSEMKDPADRKKIIDEIRKPEEASAAGANS